ncbi:metallophosphoesterase [Paenibacillus nanensis]|uniref:Metallophosphoesterase n=1 Tax=Paenibacillus nanensis TaxID=393251 RepID=A0A3A1VGY9_9BACL|nr:metallophosphoesterase [Paenibacillus nanensis]RIX60179.1 metallophosphoesterase [Paenibacillus nanensis]
MHIRTKVHTILMLVGSTECGKSTFAREVLIPQLQRSEAGVQARSNVQYLSSDAIRQDILGYGYDKYDQIMLEASSHAFQLLFERLRLVTSFPINAEFVVLDTLGLADDFRAKVREVAKENNYNVEVILFDYRKRDDYYSSERSKKLISGHLNRLKRDVLPVLSREGYAAIHKVKAKNFFDPSTNLRNPDYTVDIQDWDAYLATQLPREYNYIVVGDVHECVLELQGLLKSYGFLVGDDGKLQETDRVRDTKVILAGDWIDKGKKTREIVEFLYANREHILLVLGNHENFVYKYLRGDIGGADPELLETYFDSAAVLSADEALRAKFNLLVEQSQPFYRRTGTEGPTYYVTHAPCRNKYIGKLDANSLRHQRNFRLDREGDTEEQLTFLREEAVSNHPYHLFGHVAAKQAFRLKNKLHLDTGCVHGNQLSSVLITFKPFFKSFRSQNAAIVEPLPALFKADEKKVELKELDDASVRRLRYSSNNRINYISGTMSPADKDMAAGELESLAKGLDYYRERGAHEVVLQPKYMGSRCNVYLFRDMERSYAVSRNGYRITSVNIVPVYEALLARLGGYMEKHGVAGMILDGELMPWKTLGEGLIERQFKPIEKALETELAFLKQNGFEEALTGLIQQYEASGFEKEQFALSKSALAERYGPSVYQNYKYVREVRDAYVPIAEHEAAYLTYKRQMELYAGDAELAYKPFAILKEMMTSGEERLPEFRTSEMYRILSDDECLVLDLSDKSSYAKAEQFFRQLTTEQGMEGVVIKPEAEKQGVVPYLKVRNAGYLSIIYGYDYKFPHKYNKLLKQKNMMPKLQTSLSEHRLGQSLLAIKLDDISPDNERYKEIAASLLFEVEKEKDIDPRL